LLGRETEQGKNRDRGQTGGVGEGIKFSLKKRQKKNGEKEQRARSVCPGKRKLVSVEEGVTVTRKKSESGILETRTHHVRRKKAGLRRVKGDIIRDRKLTTSFTRLNRDRQLGRVQGNAERDHWCLVKEQQPLFLGEDPLWDGSHDQRETNGKL